MAARTPAGLQGAALQRAAMSASLARAAVADPVPERMGRIPANWATADLPRVPWLVRDVTLTPAVTPGDATGDAPTRTDRLNALLGR